MSKKRKNKNEVDEREVSKELRTETVDSSSSYPSQLSQGREGVDTSATISTSFENTDTTISVTNSSSISSAHISGAAPLSSTASTDIFSGVATSIVPEASSSSSELQSSIGTGSSGYSATSSSSYPSVPLSSSGAPTTGSQTGSSQIPSSTTPSGDDSDGDQDNSSSHYGTSGGCGGSLLIPLFSFAMPGFSLGGGGGLSSSVPLFGFRASSSTGSTQNSSSTSGHSSSSSSSSTGGSFSSVPLFSFRASTTSSQTGSEQSTNSIPTVNLSSGFFASDNIGMRVDNTHPKIGISSSFSFNQHSYAPIRPDHYVGGKCTKIDIRIVEPIVSPTTKTFIQETLNKFVQINQEHSALESLFESLRSSSGTGSTDTTTTTSSSGTGSAGTTTTTSSSDGATGTTTTTSSSSGSAGTTDTAEPIVTMPSLPLDGLVDTTPTNTADVTINVDVLGSDQHPTTDGL